MDIGHSSLVAIKELKNSEILDFLASYLKEFINSYNWREGLK
jgi:hypothetical protein